MKYLYTILTLSMLAACTTTTYEFPNVTDGEVSVMDSEDMMAMKIGQADAKANEAYFNAEAKKYGDVSDPTAQVAIRALDALDTTKRNPTNGNDVKIAEANASVAKVQAYTGLGGAVAGGLFSTALGITGIKEAASLVTALGTQDSISIDAEGDVEGAIGQGNTYTGAGIPLNEGELATVALGTPTAAAEEETGVDLGSCADPRPLIPVEVGSNEDVNGCFDTNLDGLVCSTGGGLCADNTI